MINIQKRQLNNILRELCNTIMWFLLRGKAVRVLFSLPSYFLYRITHGLGISSVQASNYPQAYWLSISRILKSLYKGFCGFVHSLQMEKRKKCRQFFTGQINEMHPWPFAFGYYVSIPPKCWMITSYYSCKVRKQSCFSPTLLPFEIIHP